MPLSSPGAAGGMPAAPVFRQSGRLPPTIGADDESAGASRAARRIRLVDPVVARGAVRARTPGVTIPELDEEYDDEDKEGEHQHRHVRKHLASPSSADPPGSVAGHTFRRGERCTGCNRSGMIW